LGDYENITLEAELEEDVPDGKLQSEHTKEMFDKINAVLTKEFSRHNVKPK